MSDQLPVGDLVTAVSNALHGDRSRLDALVAGARQRTEARVLDSLAPPVRQRLRAEHVPAPVARAIRRLTRADEELARKVAALQDQSDQALLRVVEALAALRRDVRRVAPVASPGARPASPGVSQRSGRAVAVSRRRVQRVRQARHARLQAARVQIRNVSNVINTVQAAAYGEKGSLLATGNLLLAGNQLFWTALDPLLETMGVLNTTSATALAAIAPLASLMTGQILLGNRQPAYGKRR